MIAQAAGSVKSQFLDVAISLSLGDTIGFQYDSMQFRDADVMSAVDAVSKITNVPIQVDWKGIEAARLMRQSKISLSFRNLTTFDTLALILEQVYDLDQIRISSDANGIFVSLAPPPTIKQPK